jgi:hypothetical protein
MTDEEIKALVKETVTTGLKESFAQLKTGVEEFVGTSIEAAVSQVKIDLAPKADDKKTADPNEELSAQFQALKKELEAKDGSLKNQRKAAALLDAATALGVKSPTLVKELLSNRAKTVLDTPEGGITIDGKRPKDFVAEFLASDDGADFRPTKSVAADKPDAKGNDTTDPKAAVEDAWTILTKSFST